MLWRPKVLQVIPQIVQSRKWSISLIEQSGSIQRNSCCWNLKHPNWWSWSVLSKYSCLFLSCISCGRWRSEESGKQCSLRPGGHTGANCLWSAEKPQGCPVSSISPPVHGRRSIAGRRTLYVLGCHSNAQPAAAKKLSQFQLFLLQSAVFFRAATDWPHSNEWKNRAFSQDHLIRSEYSLEGWADKDCKNATKNSSQAWWVRLRFYLFAHLGTVTAHGSNGKFLQAALWCQHLQKVTALSQQRQQVVASRYKLAEKGPIAAAEICREQRLLRAALRGLFQALKAPEAATSHVERAD